MGALGGTICDPVLEWSLEVMIRNQNKRDNQYFLLMPVVSRLSKSPSPFQIPEGSEQQQRGSGHQGGLTGTSPPQSAYPQHQDWQGKRNTYWAPNCQCKALLYTEQTLKDKPVTRQNLSPKGILHVCMNPVPLAPVCLLTHMPNGICDISIQISKKHLSQKCICNSCCLPWPPICMQMSALSFTQPYLTLRPCVQATRLLRPWGFSRQEYWSGLPFPPPGDLPDPGIEPSAPALAGGFFNH